MKTEIEVNSVVKEVKGIEKALNIQRDKIEELLSTAECLQEQLAPVIIEIENRKDVVKADEERPVTKLGNIICDHTNLISTCRELLKSLTHRVQL